ncbi:uncharacterized protein BDZ99DRAFT_499688 [Mytilinidion resinicola]|uniref:Uncharacterized protein n=1 Tax=Mytilinidion resinicola TaxID=574789 RepID=A0A6A6YK65_9PEZI|nr:uncharacterized protein BDZ99DRAFT_499688 [Mytilinidion resinicola]KAF2808354.1 hypothetical protein BDZ99DRAFT_499688 [Mytilinidion resinicola]
MKEKVDNTDNPERDHENTTLGNSDESSTEQHDAEKPIDQSDDEEKGKEDIARRSTRPDVFFSFGPNRSYFIYTNPRSQYWGNTAVVKAIPDTWHSLYAASIAPEGDLLIACQDEHLSPAWTWINAPEQVIATSAAEQWMKHRTVYKQLFDKIASSDAGSLETLRNISVTIGPKGSYFAKSSSGTLQHNLPADLASEIQTKKTANPPIEPTQVALGIAGTWIALWSDTSCTYNVGTYARLEENLRDTTMGPVVFAALSAHDAEHFFLVYGNGTIGYCVPATDSDYICHATNAYMQSRARQDGTTFQFKQWHSKSTTQMTISPATKFDYPAYLGKAEAAPRAWSQMVQSRLSSIETGTMRRLEMYKLGRRENMVAMGSAAVSTAAVCRALRFSGSATLVAAGAAAGGTGALCLWLQK